MISSSLSLSTPFVIDNICFSFYVFLLMSMKECGQIMYDSVLFEHNHPGHLILKLLVSDTITFLDLSDIQCSMQPLVPYHHGDHYPSYAALIFLNPLSPGTH